MGRLRFTPLIEPLTATPAQQRAFEDANVDFYAGVDWALDISDAEFEEVDLGGIPGHLVRRDPATSALVTREKALEGVWRTLDLSGTWWDIALNDIARSRMPSEVLVAPRRHAKFRRLVEGLNLLRDAGVAEPN